MKRAIRAGWPFFVVRRNASGEVVVDGGGGLAAFAHGENDGCGAEHDVSAREDARKGRLVRLGVRHHDVAALVDLEAVGGRGNERIRRVADRDDDRVDVEDEFAALDLDGAAASGGVGLAELVLEALESDDLAHVVAKDALGVLKRAELDAFLLGVVDFLDARWHFGLAAAVDEVDLLRAEAQGHPARVHRDVAAAEDPDARAVPEGRVGVRLVVGLHEVGAGEVLVGAEDADEVLALDAHELGKAGAGADEDGVETVLLHEVLELAGAADDEVGLDLDAEILESVDLVLHDGLRKAELGDAVDEDAAALVEGLEESHGMSGLGAVGRAGDRGGAGADDGDALSGGGRGDGLGLGAGLAGEVGAEALDAADGDGLVDGLQQLAHRAVLLALLLLGADASADRRKERGFADDLQGALEVAGRGLREKAGDVDRNRAALDAGLRRTLHAARRLGLRHLGGVAVATSS